MGLLDGKLDRVLELFFEQPNRAFTVRQVAMEAKIPKSTAQGYLVELRKQNLISDENQAIISDQFKIKKIHFFVERLFDSGFIEYLEKVLKPSCIIIFGSIAKGDSIKESDVDIFVENTTKSKPELEPFERKLGHPIQLFQESIITDLPDRLFNNVVNGIKLKGYMKIR